MKRIISFFLCVLMLLSLAACSETESTPALGSFSCISAEYEGVVIDPAHIYDGGAVLELNENGQGSFRLADKSGAVKWHINKDELTLIFDNESYVSKLENDEFAVELFDSGVLLTFRKDGAGSNVVIADTAGSTELQSAWNKSFYGWWKIEDAAGDWQEYDNMWFDSFAVIQLDENGRGDFVMWDEDSSYDEPICRIDVSADSPEALYAIEGAFIDCVVDNSSWSFDTNSGFDEMITVELPYSDSKGSFTAVIYLRPWGVLWDDVQEKSPDLLPYYYEDWYLPLVEAGSYMPMELEIN